VRALDNSEATPMAGTEGAYCTPIFSPDGQWLAFFDPRARELRKIPIQGGPPVTVVKTGGIYGATWGNDNTIIYCDGTVRVGLQRVSSAGGTPEWITHVDSTKGETAHRWPVFLPGGKAFLFAIVKGVDDVQIVVQRLDTGQRRLLVQGGTFPQYVPTGHLVYVRGGRLMAVPFDVDRLQVKGTAVPVAENVREASTGAAEFGLSPQGSLVYVPGGTQSRLVWVSRNGKEQPLAAPAHAYDTARLSPDGRRVAVGIGAEQGTQIWIYDLSREPALTRLTFEGTNNISPVWTPDGKRIVFQSNKEGPPNLFWQLADGSGGPERLTTSEHLQAPMSWSPDGQLLAFIEVNPTTGRDIWVQRLSDRKAQPFVRTPFNETAPRFSPDGRWLAYASDESGHDEIYVQPYPGPGGKWLISTEGGTEPAWNPNGRELFYRSGDKMMSVDIATQPGFAAGKPRMLFEGQYEGASIPTANYDFSPDGQRLLMVTKESEQKQINVVLNWFEELKRRVPTGK
jgi:WD40 repeat protein